MKSFKKYSLTAIGIALALGLLGCSEQQTSAVEKPVKEQVSELKAALSSGISLENMDKSIRAQDDFYEHINGNWLKKTEIPADKSNYGSFSQLYDNSQKALKTVIEAAVANKNAVAGSDEKKLADFYNSYMDEVRVSALGIKPLQAEIKNIKAVKDHKAVTSLMADILIKGGTTPLGWYVDNDAKNSSEYGVYIYQAGLGLPDRDYYLKDDEKFSKIRTEYNTYISKLLSKAGIKNSEQAAKNIIALETKLAKVQWSRVENRDATKTYNKLNIEKVNEMLGQFDFLAYLEKSNINSEQVIISQPTYIEAFGKLFSETEVAIWQDYLAFHYIQDYAELLSSDFEKLNFDFYSTTLKGIKEQKPRWKKAVDSANSVLGEVLGKVYVKDNFPPEAKQRMNVMVQNLIKGFEIAINDLEWMSPETKIAAKEKLNKFTSKIGYPDKWKDYSALEIKADDLVGNFVRYSQWTYADMTNKLGKPVDRSEWHMTPQTVNAYYNPVNNEIVFPAAILQPPFFNLDADDAVNYGAIGAVIGHELGHGFDDQGAKYDGDGNLRDWWSESDLKQFEKRGANLVSFYDKFKPFDDANVNGQLTLGENIGDLGGLTVAYKAYQMSLNGHKSSKIDGYNGEQRFFMGWSQIWRRKYRDEELRNRLMTDPHSPSHYRVIGILANMPEFYKAFDVKQGDKMYIQPEKRVKIW
ncbi:M13 family metallopeptidase [Pseudoalteromonas denitrificans]|uniref:Endothelin-converting enzyme. Metallo peptidase. MEROPS family M13 n=1 Tax=Pseudoalteromonas denitrificans DSM 6059 TaxID=1123010 RepID=A0A1I1QN24_9GAMM|nr:M13 family metallopeptidase [Pseudoalteromonas denitrificans]SFD23407.1 endothelin-converting enzyme . Metallo peptidase. MEROPS family M13 [Pseudoalteromonas denitrificans DSM 6059]